MEIRPFKALRFDPAVVGDVADCISAPYDVIDADEQQRLYEKSPYNIVRIIRGKTTEVDGPDDNQYTRASDLFNNWLADGALKPDPAETIYAYVQDFQLHGEKFQRRGFVALGKLEDFGADVHPHENTLDAPLADRLKLMHATAAQFGQIFMLYDDAENIADDVIKQACRQKPLVDFTDDNGVTHRLFAITKPENIEAVCGMMSGKEVVIADGHHRYETALNYYRQTQNPAAAFRMMTFVNMQNTGLVILPTHRAVGNVKDFDLKRLIDDLKDNFLITEFSFSGADEKQKAKQEMLEYIKGQFEDKKNAFGIYTGSGGFLAVVLTNARVMEAIAEHNPSWRGLDVAVLHKLILEKVLGITETKLAQQSNIEYIKDIGNATDESMGRVDRGETQAMFFMNPTRIEQVEAVAAAGEKMPQKSTFFYPKIFTGLTIYPVGGTNGVYKL